MNWRDRARWGPFFCTVFLCLLFVCLLACYGAEVTSQEPPQTGGNVLFPPDRSVLLSGDFDVICKPKQGELEVEGEVYPWEPFEPPLGVAHVNLYSGRNKLQIGSRKIEVFVAKTPEEPGGPEGWEIWRVHPVEGQGAKRCADCHQTQRRNDRIHVGEPSSYKACFECHKQVEFEVIHSHPLEPIEHCQMCHCMHGSKHKALLKAPAKKLCADCHDS